MFTVYKLRNNHMVCENMNWVLSSAQLLAEVKEHCRVGSDSVYLILNYRLMLCIFFCLECDTIIVFGMTLFLFI